MATDDTIEFDDDDFLNDMDDGEWDGLGEMPADDRTPISKVGMGAIDSILTDTSLRTVGKALKDNALPKEYGAAIDMADSALDTGMDLVDAAKKEMEPAVDSVKDLVRNNTDKIDKLLPEFIAKRVKAFGEEDSREREYVDPIETAIQAASSSIFDRNQVAANAEYTVAKDTLEGAKTDLSRLESKGYLQAITESVTRLSNYQDTVLIDFQRKSLELQHRQFFMARDLLQVTKASVDVTKSQLQAIMLNTGLPDAVKLRLDENYRQSIQDSVVGKLRDTSGEFISQFTGKLGERVKEKVVGAAGTLRDAVTQGVDGVLMAQDAAESIADAGGDRLEMAGGLLGGAGIQWLSNKAAKWIGERIKDDPRILDGTANLQYLMENYPGLLSDWAQSDKGIDTGGLVENIPGYDKLTKWLNSYRPKPIVMADTDYELIGSKALRQGKLVDRLTGNTVKSVKDITGAVDNEKGEEVLSENEFNMGISEQSTMDAESSEPGWFTELVKDLIPQADETRQVVANLQTTALESVGMDQLMRRSWIEIIPGYLSRILEQVTNIATGGEGDRVVYSTETEQFTTTGEMDKRLTDKVFNQDILAERRNSAGLIVDKIDKDNQLSQPARELVIDKLLENRDRGNGGVFSLDALRDSTAFDEETSLTQEVNAVVNTNFDPKSSNVREQQAMSRQFRSLGTQGNLLDNVIADYTKTGEKDALRRIGVLTTDREGKDVVDNESIASRFVKASVPLKPVVTANANVTEVVKETATDITEVVKEPNVVTPKDVVETKPTVDNDVEPDKVTKPINSVVADVTKSIKDKDISKVVGDKYKDIYSKAKSITEDVTKSIKDKETIKETVTDVSKTLKNTYNSISNTAVSQYNELSKAAKEEYGEEYKSANEVVSDVSNTAKEGYKSLKDKASDKYKDIKEEYKDVSKETIKETVTDVSKTLKDKASDKYGDDYSKAKELVKGNVKSLSGKVENANKSVRDKVSDNYNSVKETVADVTDSVKEGYKDRYKKTVEGVTRPIMDSVKSYTGIMDGLAARFTDDISGKAVWRVINVGKSPLPTETIPPVTPSDNAGETVNDVIRETANITHGLLEGVIAAVKEYGVSGNVSNTADAELSESGILSKGINLAGRATKATADTLGSYYKGMFNLGKNAVGLGGDVLSKSLGFLTQSPSNKSDEPSDVYVESDAPVNGRRRPRLRQSVMMREEYFDAETLEPITSINDINGAVLDNDGNVILTEKESKEVLLDSKGSVISRMGGGLLSMGKGIVGSVSSLYGLYGTAAMTALGLGKKALVGLTGKIQGIRDVFVAGDSKPRLYARLLQAGHYMNASDGQPIYSVDDIDGEVIDIEGNTVLSIDDLKQGLVDRFGITIDAKGITTYLLGIAKRIAGIGIGIAGKGVRAVGAYYRGLGSVASATAGGIINRFKGKDDDELPGSGGDDSNIVERQDTQIELMTAMLTWMDGKGAANDPMDYTDTNVSPIPKAETVADVVSDSNKKVVGGDTTADMTSNIDYLLDGKTKGPLFDKTPVGDEIITGDDEVSDVSDKAYQSAILDTMRDIRGPVVPGDKDGDGDRDGGWRDILQQRKEKREAKAASKEGIKKAKDEEETKDGKTFGMIGGLLTGIGGILSSGFSGLSDIVMAVLAGKGIKDIFSKGGDIPDMDKSGKSKGGKGGTKGGGKKGLIKSALGKGANLIKGASGALMNVGRTGAMALAGTGLGTAALGSLATAGSVIGGAATAAASVVAAAPVALIVGGAAVVGAAGYGIYKAAQYFSRNADLEPIESLRYLEYGTPLNNSDFIYNIRALEDSVLSDISWSDGIPSIDESPRYYFDEWAEDWGMLPDSQEDADRWMGWFKNRFAPVLLTHLSVLESLDGGFLGSSLDDIDDDLDDKLKSKFIIRTRFNEKDKSSGLNPYGYTISPMRNVALGGTSDEIGTYAERLLASLKLDDIDDFDIESEIKGLKSPITADELARPVATIAAVSVMSKTGKVSDTSSPVSKKPASGGSVLNKAVVIAAAPIMVGSEVIQRTFSFFSNLNRIEPLEALRYMEYGVPLNDTVFIGAVRDLESEVLDAIDWTDGVPSINRKNNYFWGEIGALMGLDITSEADSTEWGTWFVRRFKPVLLTHLSVLRRLDDGSDLDDIDDDLDESLKVQFILATRYTERDKQAGINPYGWTASPMRGARVFDNSQAISAYVDKLLNAGRKEALDDFDIEKIIPTGPITKDSPVSNAMVRKQDSFVSRTTAAVKSIANGKMPGGSGVSETNSPTPEVAQKIKTGNTVLLTPVEGRLSSDWGLRSDPFTGKSKGHKGLDYAAPRNTPVYAASDGVIGRQYRSTSYGNVVYLFHPDGRSTRYAHMAGFGSKRQGDTVQQGDLLGYVGSTGNSTGNHLHFEYRDGQAQYSKPLNPTPYYTSADKRKMDVAIKDAKDFTKEESAPVTSEASLEGVNTLADVKLDMPNVTGRVNSSDKPIVGDIGYKPNIEAMSMTTAGIAGPAPTILPAPVQDSNMDLLITEQDKQAMQASQQRASQITLQEATIERMDKLIDAIDKQTLEGGSVTKEDMMAVLADTRSTTVEKVESKLTKPTAPKSWPKTKATGVVSFKS